MADRDPDEWHDPAGGRPERRHRRTHSRRLHRNRHRNRPRWRPPARDPPGPAHGDHHRAGGVAVLAHFSIDEGDTGTGTDTITVTASDGATVGFDVGTDATWLDASPNAGTTPETVTVTVDTAGLSAGTYNGTVTMPDPTGPYDPVQVPVSLNVTTPTASMGPP